MNKSIERCYRMIIFLVILMIFGEPYGLTIIGSAYRYCLLALIAVLLLLYIIFVRKFWIGPLDRFPISVMKISWALFFISCFFWSAMHNAYSYIGISVALILYLFDFKFTNKLIIWLVYLSLFLTAIEYFTQHYIFINVIHDNELDEKMYGGMIGVFRAKGLFYGPLSAGIFVIMAFFLNCKNIWLLLAGILVCFFANSRLGMVILVVPLLIFLLKNRNPKYLMGVFGIAVASAFVIYKFAPHVLVSIERVGMLSDLSAQAARFFYWTEGIKLFSSYPLQYIIFGNNGYYNSIYENNPESGWICLLTDNGLLGFLFYFIPIMYCFIKFLRQKSYYYFIITGLLFLTNFLLTAHLSGTGNLMYWLVVFELYNKAKFGYSKIDMMNSTICLPHKAKNNTLSIHKTNTSNESTAYR